MAENRFPCAPAGCGNGSREMVCVEANRILDSCKDRDCFENVRVFLTDFGNEIIEHTNSIRVKCAKIVQTSIHLEPVQFNRGFYSVYIRFFVKLVLEACVGAGRSQEFEGVAVLEKKVILFGGESNVCIFKSNPDATDFCAEPSICGMSRNVPVAVVEVVDPIVLDVRVVEEARECQCCCCCCDIPESIDCHVGGQLSDGSGRRYLVVSLGIFSIVRIVRPAEYLIQATEYCVPDKECVTPKEDDPCGMFRTMAFPTHEFCPVGTPMSPPPASEGRSRCGC